MDADSFHRLAKVLADSGEAISLQDMDATFSRYGVRILLDDLFSSNICAQVIALTAINSAARSFRGNVEVIAPFNSILIAPGFEGISLTEFMSWLGIGDIAMETAASWPTINIGNPSDAGPTPTIRPWADGWCFGIGNNGACTTNFFAPACVAAGGLAVSEAFSILRQDNPYAGRRNITLSLWSVASGTADVNPPEEEVPSVSSAWLVGLGHLGQAYAWILGFMRPAQNATLYLQDIDVVTKSTLSTSMLSVTSDLNKRKTRIVAKWLEQRGYSIALVERRFDGAQRVGLNEPQLALFGVDNAAARRILEGAGLRFVIDAGLGSGYRDFRAIRVRTFPGPSEAAQIWAADNVTTNSSQAIAYKTLLAAGADPCGVTTLATRAVGAPFVGCVAAAYVVAEFIRHEMGVRPVGFIDLNLRNPHDIDAGTVQIFAPIN
ncbi:hypothetical protein CAP31_14340 [Sulfuriferula sp. AH1]|uniref:hypothetical protein n=1 Tax=Sulfuriferula sp. AH1 TaxID=1985873 RepID=UPI000B3B9113|nr:hypothetical protein [Sulfuriferula sp. AH1]ARU32737.1 hypothetical protein CAP31_14340 [Sulfuriferula sp. AH1]